MTVSLFDTAEVVGSLRPEVDAAIARVLDSGRFILGPEVSNFEREFAEYLGAQHVIGVANGTDALVLALRALGVGPGDEVIVPSFTFYASAEAIALVGATPVFCDIDLSTFCITAQTVRAVMTSKTRAVVAVHLFGNVAPVDEILALGVPVIEDAAQSAGTVLADGRRPGTLGTLATFSFFPSKNLGCCGDGGAIVTNELQLDQRLRMLRFHGSHDKVTFELVGYNSRLDELQAAILRAFLPHLDGWSKGRCRAARAYQEAGLGQYVELPQPTAGCQPAWHLYVIRHRYADQIAERLSQQGIATKAYYRTPIHRQPAMARWGERAVLPVTDEAARDHLAIPIGSTLSDEDVAAVVGAVADAVPTTISSR